MDGQQSKPSSSPPTQYQGQQYQQNHTLHTRCQTPPYYYTGPQEADPQGSQLSSISFQSPFQYSNIQPQFVPQFSYDLNKQAYAAPRMPVGGNPSQAAMYQTTTGVRQQPYYNQSSMRPSGYQISQPQPSQGLYTQQQIMFMPPPQVIMPMAATNYPQRMSSSAYQNSMPTSQGLFQLPQENTTNFTPHAHTHTYNNPPAVFYNAAKQQNRPPSASGMSGSGQPPTKKRERTVLQIIDPNSVKDILHKVQHARGSPPSSGTLRSHGTVSGQEISHIPQNEIAVQFAAQVAQVALSTHPGGNQQRTPSDAEQLSPKVALSTHPGKDQPRAPSDATHFAAQAPQSAHPGVNQQKMQSDATQFAAQVTLSTDQGRNQQRTLSDEFLGRGSFGEVYRRHIDESNTTVAVKIIKHGGTMSEKESLRNFKNEIKILKKLDHQRLIKFLGYLQKETCVEIFLEYMPNGSVKEYMSNHNEPFSESMTAKITKDILEGIIYLHERNILHRDVKGSNVLLDCEMNAKLGDFGISKEIETLTNSNTCCHTYAGSPYWMSPERIRGEKYGKKADIWSIGCTVVEMLTMHPPWHKFETNAALFKIGNGNDPIYHLPLAASAKLVDFLSQTFRQKSEERPKATELFNHSFIL